MKSLEFFWETVSLLCRAFRKDTEKSGWSVCDFHHKGLQDNRYLHGLFCSVQSYFNTSLLSEVVIYFHVQNTQLKERRIFTQNVFSVSRTNWP